MTELLEALTVEELRAGDLVFVHPLVGLQVVSAVRRYDDGTLVVWYFRQGEVTFESKARDRGGMRTHNRLCERSLRPMHGGEILRARRGDPEQAERLRDRLRDEIIARHEKRGFE